jgi:hypothetical protein
MQTIVEGMPYKAGLDIPQVMQVSDSSNLGAMADVLRYLEANDDAGFTTMRLPPSRSFNSYGEPSIIKVTTGSDKGRSAPK